MKSFDFLTGEAKMQVSSEKTADTGGDTVSSEKTADTGGDTVSSEKTFAKLPGPTPSLLYFINTPVRWTPEFGPGARSPHVHRKATKKKNDA